MKNKQFKIGAILSYGAIAFNILSGLLYTPWMIGQLGNDQYGLYTLAVSVINIFLMDFGIGSAVTKFLSNFYAEEQQEAANRFMGIVYKIFMIIAGVIAIALTVFYFLIDALYANLEPSELTVFKQLFIIVAVYSVISFPFMTFNGVLTANERFIELKTCDFLQKVTNVALIIVFLLLGKGVYALVLVHAFTNFVFLLTKYLFIRRNTKQRADMTSWDGPMAKRLFGYSVWTTVMSIAQRCIFNIMPTLIAAMIDVAEVTLFSIASTLEGYVYTFANAINGMLMPRVSKALVKKDADEQLTGMMVKIGRLQICLVGLIFVGFVCVGRDFTSLWLQSRIGDGYELVYIGALFMILPNLFSMPQQVASNALLLKDVVREQALIYAGMAGINVVLSIILLPIVGVVGAAISVCIAYLFSFVCKNILYHKRLPVKLGVYFSKVYVRWSVVAVATGATYFLGVRHIPVGGWFGFLLKACLVAAVYLISFVALYVDKATLAKVKGRLKKGS